MALRVKLVKQSSSTLHRKDLQLGYRILLFLDSTADQKIMEQSQRSTECNENDDLHVQNCSMYSHFFPTADLQVLASLLQMGSKVLF